MALLTRRTVILQIGSAIVKVTPRGGRLVAITAPKAVKITDRQGKRLTKPRQEA